MLKNSRKLGDSEQLSYLINQITPHNIVATGELTQKIDEEILRHALNLLQKRHVALNYNLDVQGQEENFYYLKTINKIDIKNITSTDKNHWLNIMESELIHQLVIPNKPFIRCIQVINGQKVYLMLNIQHMIADGISLVNLMLELIQISNNIRQHGINITNDLLKEMNVYHHINQSLEELIPEKYKTLPEHSNIDTIGIYLPDEVVSQYTASFPIQERSTGLVHFDFDEEKTNSIHQICKLKTISIHTFICACLILVLRKNLKHVNIDASQKIMMGCNTPIDLRNYLSPPVSRYQLGFYSGLLNNFHSVSEKDDIWHLAYKIASQLKNDVASGYQFKVTQSYRPLIDSVRSADELVEKLKICQPSAGVSNMGKIEFRTNQPHFELKTLHIGASCHAYSRNENTFFICVNTFNGKLYCNFHYPKPVFRKQRAEYLTQLIIQEINTSLENVLIPVSS